MERYSNLNKLQRLIFEYWFCVDMELVHFDFTAFSDNMQSCKALKSFEMPVEECKTATWKVVNALCCCAGISNWSQLLQTFMSGEVHQWLRQISMKLPYAVLRKSGFKVYNGKQKGKLDILLFPIVWVPSKLDI